MTNITLTSKLPNVGSTIFSVMSNLAREHRAINLAQGFPDFKSSEKLTQLVCAYMQKGYNQYAPMPGVPALRERIAEKISNMYGISVHPDEEVTVTAGATQGLFSTISTFVRPGDEVIIFEPAYDSYRPAIEVNGGKVIVFELEAPDFRVDWDAVQELLSERTRMIVINNPHNPTGTILNKEDLQALERITANTEILVLSDEVYEHLVYDGEEHQSVLRFPGLRERSIATYSFGKTFHNTGWKIGYCVAPKELMAEIRKVHQYTVFSVHTPTQFALADFMENPQEYLSLNAFYQEKRDLLAQIMDGSNLKPIPSKGTYFQLFDYSLVSDEPDTEFVQRMTTEFGVAAIPVSPFYGSGRDEKVIRLCFAKKPETLERAGELLRKIK